MCKVIHTKIHTYVPQTYTPHWSHHMNTHAYIHTPVHACTYLLTTRIVCVCADKYDERKSVGGNYSWKPPKLAKKRQGKKEIGGCFKWRGHQVFIGLLVPIYIWRNICLCIYMCIYIYTLRRRKGCGLQCGAPALRVQSHQTCSEPQGCMCTARNYIHTDIYTFTHTHIYMLITCICICIYIYTDKCLYKYTRTCMYVCIYMIYLCIFICI